MIYFDAAATTLQKPPQVRKMAAYAMEHYASPGRGGYRAAMLASDAVYDCRKELAELFEAKPEDIVFTMNATHALNLAIKTLGFEPGDEVVISGFEHNAVWRPLVQIGANVKIAGRKLFDPDDTLEAFRAAIGPETKAVVCTHVSNVFGYVLPIEKIAALCFERGVPLVVDCSQSAGILPVSLGKASRSVFVHAGAQVALRAAGDRCSRMWACAAAASCGRDGEPFQKRVHAGIYARCGRSRDTQCAGHLRAVRGRAVRQKRRTGRDLRARKNARPAADGGALEPSGRARVPWKKSGGRGVVFIGNRGRGANCGKAFIAGLLASGGASLRAAGARVCRDAFFRHGSRKLLCFQHRA